MMLARVGPKIAVGVVLLLLVAGTAQAVTDTTARIPAKYRNCTALNRVYPHGLGKLNARDRTSGTPVTNFRRSTKLYLKAMSYNKGLDRDKDGVACEKL